MTAGVAVDLEGRVTLVTSASRGIAIPLNGGSYLH